MLGIPSFRFAPGDGLPSSSGCGEAVVQEFPCFLRWKQMKAPTDMSSKANSCILINTYGNFGNFRQWVLGQEGRTMAKCLQRGTCRDGICTKVKVLLGKRYVIIIIWTALLQSELDKTNIHYGEQFGGRQNIVVDALGERAVLRLRKQAYNKTRNAENKTKTDSQDNQRHDMVFSFCFT